MENKSSLSLKDHPTLADLQAYVREMELERGFDKETVIEQCLLLGEEIGELFRAFRKTTGMHCDPNSPNRVVGEEMADILIYLCALANRSGVDLEQAFRNKEEINKTRTWN